MAVPPTDPEIDLTGFLQDDSVQGHTGSVRVRCYGATDIGPRRSCNEDDFLIAELAQQVRVCQAKVPRPEVLSSEEKAFLLMVSDGMGGHAGGATASLVAVGMVKSVLMNLLPRISRAKGSAEHEILAELRNAIILADEKVREEGGLYRDLHGMACTLTLALFAHSTLYVAHAGDSRCYHWRRGVLTRLTHDHTVAQELVQRGEITPEEALTHWTKHVVTNAIGGHVPGVRVELHAEAIEAEDVVVLCSDGLTGVVTDAEVADQIAAGLGPKETCRALIGKALKRSTSDNVTVIVARFETA